jgi:hypothetical protein
MMKCYAACTGEMRNAHRISVRKPNGNKPPGRHTYEWEHNIKMDLEETACEHVDQEGAHHKIP